jgi:serine/threonine protein phosphatase PrpC
VNDVNLTVAARSDMGRVRTNNEDAFTITDLATGERLETGPRAGAVDVQESGVLLAVSDGMGGHQAGEVASALVLDSLRAALASNDGESIEKQIEEAVKRANADVVHAARTENKHGMGATLTAVFISAKTAYVAEVGDSRAYLLRNGRLRQITKDQSLVQLLVDSGVMSSEDAKVAPQKNIILQAMGRENDVRVAIGKLHLRRNDRILLCCDGVSNAISDDELRRVVSEHEPDDACGMLIDLANERGGEDNLTVIIAQVNGSGVEPAREKESVTMTFEVVQDFVGPQAGKGIKPRPRASGTEAVAEPAPPPTQAAPPPSPENAAVASAPAPPAPGAPRKPAPAPARPIRSGPILVVGFAVLATLYLLAHFLVK